MPRLASMAAWAGAVGLAVAAAVGPAVPASAATGPYVALGDSYTAGLGVPTNIGAVPDCGQSNHSYPALVAGSIGASSYTLEACAGAVTANMTQAQVLQDGTNPPQFNGLSASTSIVTVSIGANDVNVIAFIEKCMALSPGNVFGSPCKSYYTSGGTDQFAAAIAATVPKIAAVLQQIHQLAPNARVYFVGYPDLIPNSGYGCYFTVPLAAGDVGWLRGEWIAMDQAFAKVAAANSTTFVDTYTPSIGHDYCAGSQAWIQGIVQVGGWPLHPNTAGDAAMGREVSAAINAG